MSSEEYAIKPQITITSRTDAPGYIFTATHHGTTVGILKTRDTTHHEALNEDEGVELFVEINEAYRKRGVGTALIDSFGDWLEKTYDDDAPPIYVAFTTKEGWRKRVMDILGEHFTVIEEEI